MAVVLVQTDIDFVFGQADYISYKWSGYVCNHGRVGYRNYCWMTKSLSLVNVEVRSSVFLQFELNWNCRRPRSYLSESFYCLNGQRKRAILFNDAASALEL